MIDATEFISVDFHTQMARGWQVLSECTMSRSNQAEYDQAFAQDLHHLMGYRAEHSNSLNY